MLHYPANAKKLISHSRQSPLLIEEEHVNHKHIANVHLARLQVLTGDNKSDVLREGKHSEVCVCLSKGDFENLHLTMHDVSGLHMRLCECILS